VDIAYRQFVCEEIEVDERAASGALNYWTGSQLILLA